jgi:hypothetical protein
MGRIGSREIKGLCGTDVTLLTGDSEIGAIEEIERLCANLESHFFGDANSAKMQTSNNAVKNGVLKNSPCSKAEFHKGHNQTKE